MMASNPFARPFGSGPVAANHGLNVDEEEEDELYKGFGELVSTQTIHQTVAGGDSMAVPSTAMRAQMQTARPMTSNRGAGYSKQPAAQTAFDPLGDNGPAPELEKKEDNSPEYQAKMMEKEVNKLMEESAEAGATGNKVGALEKAKEAGKKERVLAKLRAKNNLDPSPELALAVLCNLATQYELNGLDREAVATYQVIVKGKGYQHGGRLRVNMGNIFFQQKKYPAAIKMYRMAMDQIGQVSTTMRFRIMRNIGNAFVRLGQFQDAIHSFEQIMESPRPDAQAGFNLIVCYYALGDKDKMKKGFMSLLAVPLDKDLEEKDEKEDENAGGPAIIPLRDPLKLEIQARRKRVLKFVRQAAKLIAPLIEKDLGAGYDWVIERLKAPPRSGAGAGSGADQGFPRIAMEMEISKGIAYLKQKDIGRAIDVFKGFETAGHEATLLDQAATNLSFLYFLEGDLKNADKYADMAVKADRYNAKALVNKANIVHEVGKLEMARELYLEAIGVEADCIEAIFNLGLTQKRLGQYEDALQAFRKLHRIIPKDPQVIFHIANLHDLLDDVEQATEWFKILQGIIPTDAGILSRLGNLYTRQQDDNAAFHNYLDCYNAYPVNMEVISWLGVWYVKSQMYEKAVQFFERAAEIEPHQIKWQLMVASCYRRMSALPVAFEIYKKVHKQEPDNVECLRYLSSIAQELNDPDAEKYGRMYRKAQRSEASTRNQFLQQDEVEDAELQMPAAVQGADMREMRRREMEQQHADDGYDNGPVHDPTPLRPLPDPSQLPPPEEPQAKTAEDLEYFEDNTQGPAGKMLQQGQETKDVWADGDVDELLPL